MRDHLILYLNGQELRIGGEDAFLTLAEFLRSRRRLTGTKIVCAEGDCGACAALVGRASTDGRAIQYSSVNSCIQFMFQLDGTHVITVEGLKHGDELSPIQKAMVGCHGTQCGFCTPGFIVSLSDLMQKAEPLDAHTVRRALVGNLCRCTGYDSIIRAAQQADHAANKTPDQLYPPGAILPALAAAEQEDVLLIAGALKIFKPISTQSAIRFRAANSDCLIVSGATDLGVQRNKGTRQFAVAMYMGGVRELHGIEITARGLCIGACSTLSELEQESAKYLPELSGSLAYFGSPLIKNAGTLAGNLVNASPIGDTIPAFYVLEGEVEIAGPDSRRWVPIETFYTGYRKTVLQGNEIVTRLRLPVPLATDAFKIYKISKRKDLDISSFGAAIWMRLSGERIEQIRIAFGGVGPMVSRLQEAEAFLSGKNACRESFVEAGEIACQEISPISDVRGSETYRRMLAKNILIKFWHDFEASRTGATTTNGSNHHPSGVRR